MSERDQYPAGVPCWVETLQPDVHAAMDFYGPLFGWEFAGPGLMPGDPPGQYFVARLRGRDVAGIGSSPEGSQATQWVTHVRVNNVDESATKAQTAEGKLLDGPFDAQPAGRVAVLADPSGAVICAWEAAAREGAQIVNEPSAWAMSTLHTADPERSIAFYKEMFGWQPDGFGPITLWRLPGYVGGEPKQPVPRDVVGAMVSNGASQPHWSVDFWIGDADATADQAAKLGGKIIVPPHDAPGFRSAVIADPQGAVLSISQLILPH
jgi:predicted enzyme related to lactoylglutathione lyase